MEHLADELLATILEGMSLDDTSSCALVCKSWYKLVNRSRFVVRNMFGDLFLCHATFGSMNRSGFATDGPVVGCGGGLVCTRPGKTQLRLFNPITRSQFAVPWYGQRPTVTPVCLAISTETKPPGFRLLYLIWRKYTTLECLVYDSAAATMAWSSTVCKVPFNLKHVMKERLLVRSYDLEPAACFSACHKAFYFMTAPDECDGTRHLWSLDTRDEVSTERLSKVATWSSSSTKQIPFLDKWVSSSYGDCVLAASGSRLILAEVDQAACPGKSVVTLKELDTAAAAWRLLSRMPLELSGPEKITWIEMAASEREVVLSWSGHLLVYHIPSGSWSPVLDVGLFGVPPVGIMRLLPFHMQLAEGDPLRKVRKPSKCSR